MANSIIRRFQPGFRLVNGSDINLLIEEINALFAPRLQTMQVLWSLTGADMNSTSDQVFTKAFNFTAFSFPSGGMIVTQASRALSGAAGGIYQAPSKAGSALVASNQSYAAVTGATSILNLTPTATASGLLSSTNLYLSLTTPLGQAATASFYLWGAPLS